MICHVLQEKNNGCHKGKVAAIHPVSRTLMEYTHFCSYQLMDPKSMMGIGVFFSVTEMQVLPFMPLLSVSLFATR
jgi:hypothetical protein